MSSASAINIENHDQLLHYLRANNRIAAQETPTFETLRGGVSNRTVLLRRAARPSASSETPPACALWLTLFPLMFPSFYSRTLNITSWR